MATTTKPKKSTRKPSAAELERRAKAREEQAEAMQASLVDQVELLNSSEGWMTYLRTAGSFHQYSLNNLMLILAQHPTAEAVAGYRQWEARGRQVRKGEKAIKIYGYSSRNVLGKDADGNDELRKIAFFPILSVFAQDQTDPIEGAEATAQAVSPVQLLQGEDDTQIAQRVREYVLSLGWTVESENIVGGANGYATTDGSKRIVVDARLSPAMTAKTTIHEVAHALLHCDGEHGGVTREIGEMEAESVAYVLGGLLGLDTTDYSIGYVTGWAKGDMKALRATAERVLTTVKTILKAIAPEDETEEEN